MATTTDKQRLKNLQESKEANEGIGSKIAGYVGDVMNFIPFGPKHSGSKGREARLADLSRGIEAEQKAIDKGDRDYQYDPEKGGKPFVKGGKVTASSRADGIAQRGKTRGKMC
jgi:hypothetical protein